MFKSIDSVKLADAVVRTKAAGTWNCPTLVVMDRISHLDQADKTRPELKYVSKGALAQWDPAKDFRFKDWVAEDFQVARDGNVWRAALVKPQARACALSEVSPPLRISAVSAPMQPSADSNGATTAPLDDPGRARTICSVPPR